MACKSGRSRCKWSFVVSPLPGGAFQVGPFPKAFQNKDSVIDDEKISKTLEICEYRSEEEEN